MGAYVHMHIYEYIHECMYMYMYICVYIYIHVNDDKLSLCLRHTCIYICINTDICMCIYIYT